MPLEKLLQDDPISCVQFLSELSNLSIPLDRSALVLDAWKKLHWSFEDTTNWKYSHEVRSCL